MKNLTFFLLLGLFLTQSCVVNKPYADTYAVDQANKIYNLSGAHYKRKASPVGVLTQLGMAGAGASFAYSAKVTTFYDGNNQKSSNDALNAVIGAAVGYGISSILHMMSGQGKTRNTDPKWIDRYNRKYGTDYLILADNSTDYQVISRSAEPIFVVKNLKDAMIFVKAFPNSSRKDQIAKQCLESSNFSRSDYETLLSKVLPNNAYATQMQEKYLNMSNGLDEQYAAVRLYPNLHTVAENKIFQNTQNPTDAIRFLQTYPQTVLKKQLLLNIFDDNTLKTDIEKIRQLYGTDFWLDKKDIPNINSSNNGGKRGYFRAVFLLSSINLEQSYFNLLDRYQWLIFSDKAYSILNLYWDLQYPKFEKGNKLIGNVRYFAQNDGKKYGTTTTVADRVIWEKLKDELKNVQIVSQNMLEPSNPNWNEWLANTQLTAGRVYEEGEMDCLIYGEIRNNSKFDLPLVLTANGDLYRKQDFSTKGTLGNTIGIIKDLNRAFGDGKMANAMDKASTQEDLLTSTEEKYYIPNLPTNRKAIYAVKIGFGSFMKKDGVNIAESAVITKVLSIKNTQLNAEVMPNHLTKSQADLQNKWIHLAKNGLPSGKVYDFYAEEEYSPEKWQNKYQEKLERERRSRERWAQLERETKEQSKLYKSTDGVKIYVLKTDNAVDNIETFIDNDDILFEDAEWTNVTITPNDESGEEAKTFDSSNDIFMSFRKATSIRVDISYEAGGKVQSGMILIANKGKWQIRIED